MQLTYHAVPRSYFDALDPARPYVPPEFAEEGFIHCTDGREATALILTHLYQDRPGPWIVLTIDKNRVAAPIRYEDPAEIFPHIYGPLNRDAIVGAREIPRAPDGAFLKPLPL